MENFIPPPGVHITKRQCLFDGNRLHIYYSAIGDGYRGTGRTRQEAVDDLKIKKGKRIPCFLR